MESLLVYGVTVLLLVTEGFTQLTCSKEKNLIKDKLETSCINLALTTVPLDIIDNDTEILLLSYNSMKSISTSVFKSLLQLVILDLSNNSMSAMNIDHALILEDLNLANNSFDHLPKLSLLKNLVKLDLSNNDIVSVPDTAFNGLSRLKELHLQMNKIQKLSEQVFQGLKLLDTLDLSFNQLTSVPPQLISDSVKMERFYLRGNSLSHIPDGFFDGLDHIAYAYLDLNPWKCTCDLKYFKEWVDDNESNIYTIEDGSPVNNEASVVCTNKLALVNFELPCHKKGDGDPVILEPHTQDWLWNKRDTTTLVKTMVAKTTQRPTTPMMTTKIKTTIQPTTTPMTTEKTTIQPTTTPMTTEKKTTIQPTTTPMTTEKKATIQPTTTQLTTEMKTTSQPTTSVITTTGQTTKHPTTPLKTSLVTTTELFLPIPHTTTLVINTTEVEKSTTSHLTLPPTTTLGQVMDTPWYTMAYSPERFPSTSKRRSWLEETIVEHCCFLHLLLYSIILILLLLQMVVCLAILTWACTSYRHYFHILREKVPRVKLIRYSWRTLQDKDDILLVRGGNSHFGQDKPVPMLVLEPGSRDYSKSYTSAILA